GGGVRGEGGGGGGRWSGEGLKRRGGELNAAASAVHEFKTANGITDRNEGARALLLDKLTELEARTEAYRKLYETMLQRMAENQQQESFPVSNARVVAPATTPLTQSYPKTKLILILALLLGVFGGIGLTLMGHNLDRSLRTERQVTQELGIDCLGIVPRLPNRHGTTPAGSDNPVIDAPFSGYADALRGIKVSIDAALHGYPSWRLGLLSVNLPQRKTSFGDRACRPLRSRREQNIAGGRRPARVGAVAPLGPQRPVGTAKRAAGSRRGGSNPSGP